MFATSFRRSKTFGNRSIFGALMAAALMAVSCSAFATQVISVSPEGEVAQVRQVVLKFDGSAVNFGDPKAPAPFALTCSDAQATQGNSRWISDREWAFEFARDLPPGVRCSLQGLPNFKTPKGEALQGKTTFAFNTGGPFVLDISPGPHTRGIEEEQFFLLTLNGAATVQSVQDHVTCLAQGMGERIPVRAIVGKDRADMLKAHGLDKEAAADPLRFVTLACNRRLTPGTKVQLVFGEGVATPSGLRNAVERRFNFVVRELFALSFSCERENAQAACSPLRPMTLRFNAPVPRKWADGVRLVLDNKTRVAPTKPQPSEGDDDNVVQSIDFAPLFPEQASMRIELPQGFVDSAGRTARNADQFPLKVATAAMPPLAKFPSAPFGIVERLAEPGQAPLLPVTLRKIEAAMQPTLSDIKLSSDADIITWWHKVNAYGAATVQRQRAVADGIANLPPAIDRNNASVQTRMVSLLAGRSDVKRVNLPKVEGGEATRPFEVVGVPVTPGFHVVEVASQNLGKALLDPAYGDARTMHVRTSVLVTNLAVHFKLGRVNAQAFVTTLDKGQPVPGATVQVSSCDGRPLMNGTSDAQGLVMFDGLSPEPPRCGNQGMGYGYAYFVSARHRAADGVDDLAFTWSDWHRGIEPWRFNLPVNGSPQPDVRVHTVFDRMLFRAGETVSMKHVLRRETKTGFDVPPLADAPTTLLVTHIGSGQQYTLDLKWRQTATGGLSAESTLAIPQAAKLGVYDVTMPRTTRHNDGYGDGTESSGQFRVEEFRLPVFQGSVTAADAKAPLVNVKAVPLAVQINYVSGGGAVGLPVRVSATVATKGLYFADYPMFGFAPPQRDASVPTQTNEQQEGASGSQDVQDQRVIANNLPLTLDRQGVGSITLDKVPAVTQPHDLALEATYADPNGEIQTLRHTTTLWPAAVIAGIKTEGWVSLDSKGSRRLKLQALALDLNGVAKAGVALGVKARARITKTNRKRMVGGFYSYDNTTETKDLGSVCSGSSDTRGLLLCEVTLTEPGEVELIVTAKDASGLSTQAAASVWVTRLGELWFGSDDSDRIDLLPEKKSYNPGDVAKFQVRMPFRHATALVTVEREGILESKVVQLEGQDPTITVAIKDTWAPNAYVSVLVLRGRVRHVPWYSFFTWGIGQPRAWWAAYRHEGVDHVAPTAMVDLSKPTYRMGVAEIRVGHTAHTLNVKLSSDKPAYTVRGKAKVTVSVKLPNGQPAANAEVALAAVDQALLELMPNTSWNLLEAMLQRRSWGVQTSTAQMEIIGRRHYGRKAVPAGGGGGRSNTRELLDTLLLWNPKLMLDAQGQAVVDVPLNDAITSFKIVAVADAAAGLFGTGSTTIKVTQDLQIIAGLPPLVRDGDQFLAMLTVRNTTAKPMKAEVTARATLLQLAAQSVDIPAGEAREVSWPVTVPAGLSQTRAAALMWEVSARDTLAEPKDAAKDALKITQRVVPDIPLTVQQATLVQVDGQLRVDVVPPADATNNPNGMKRGGIRMALQATLVEGLPAVKEWFARYPFVCLEQRTSKSIGMRDAALWQSVVGSMPSYLDGDGLAYYFPVGEGSANRGSDVLTSYILAATHEAADIDARFALPDNVRAPMERGLIAFVEGRITREFWSPRQDLDLRKLTAMEALSRYGKAHARMAQSITIVPNQWPTGAVIDWLQVLKRVPDIANRDTLRAEATAVLKSRLSYQGTKMIFSTERDDYWWWLMINGDVNSARLILAALGDPEWKDDMGRLVNGFIGRQQSGVWHTTTANLWGGLALERFAKTMETQAVAGVTQASLAATKGDVTWSKVVRAKADDPAGLPHQTTAFGAPSAPGTFVNNTMFMPWSSDAAATLNVTHTGSGKPWLTMQSVAAVALKEPFAAGYQIKKTITPVEQAVPGVYTRGDVLRVALEVNASSDMTWVVISDPIPAGATILGSGLGRDSQKLSAAERRGWSSFEERSFEAYRSYYQHMGKGVLTMEYTLRLNNVGVFALPPTRVEAMYAPEMFGETPNATVKVQAVAK